MRCAVDSLLEPLPDRRFVKMDEYAFSKLLNRRQPVSVTGDRCAANAQLNVFDIAIRPRRRGFKSREPVEARHLPQAMDSDQVLDRREVDLGIRICPNITRREFAHIALRLDDWRRFPGVHLRTCRTPTALVNE